MPWEFTEHHVRPNVFYWSPTAYKERNEVKTRREQAQAAYNEAKVASSESRHADAEQLLLHSVTAWPDNPRFLLALANCIFLDRGRPEEALQWYDEAIRLRDCPAYRAARCRARSALGQLEGALEDASGAAEGEPQNADYQFSRALLLERLGRFQAALEGFGAALRLLRAEGRPIFECLFNRGYCYKMLGQTDAAITELEAAMAQNTTSMTVRTVLGVLYVSRRRYARALDVFSVVAAQQSASASAANNAALAAYLAVTSDFDDSSPATRAASAAALKQRAARMATVSAARREGGATADSVEGSPSRLRRRYAAGSGRVQAAVATAEILRNARGRAATSLLDSDDDGDDDEKEEVAAVGQAPHRLPPISLSRNPSLRPATAPSAPSPSASHHPSTSNPGRDTAPGKQDHRTRQGGRHPEEGDQGDDGSSTDSSSSSSSSDDEGGGEEARGITGGGTAGGGGGGGGGGEPLPTVYLPADPRQWAADVVRENESQTVWEADKRSALEGALRGFDAALSNQEARMAEERKQ
ncbi:hypothetical protein Agub_g12173, partial [Astrephomene gubernaculifera]